MKFTKKQRTSVGAPPPPTQRSEAQPLFPTLSPQQPSSTTPPTTQPIPEFRYNTPIDHQGQLWHSQQAYEYPSTTIQSSEQHISMSHPTVNNNYYMAPPTINTYQGVSPTSQYVPALPQQVISPPTSQYVPILPQHVLSLPTSHHPYVPPHPQQVVSPPTSQHVPPLPQQTTRSVNSVPNVSAPLSVSQNYLSVPNRTGQRIRAVAEQTNNAAAAVIDTSSNAMAIASGLCDAAKPMGQLFGIFMPLLKDVVALADNVLGLYQTAEHNKEICRFMVTRVLMAQGAIKPLLLSSPDTAFFTEGNYSNLQSLHSIMGEIITFVKNVSQTKGITKMDKVKRFLGGRSIEQSLKDLAEQLDSALAILNLGITVESAMRRDEQIAALSKEIKNTEKVIETVQTTPSDNLEIVSAVAKLLGETNDNHREKSISESQKRVLKFIDADPLKTEDYDPLRTTSVADKHITKWRRKTDNLEVAFREIRGCSPIDKDAQNFEKQIRREVTILRMLAKQPDVVMFHGIAESGAKRFLVTEWPTYGTLRNYYSDHPPEMFDWSKRIKFAFQICRALAYIHSADILHHDVRSDNIIITSHEQAKLANFGLSRFVRDSTKNVARLREQVRYMAPEKLENEKYRYDFKCEMYSFGVLLWEIAEVKRPFGEEIQLDICQMREVVKETSHLSFSDNSGTPSRYREIAEQAQQRDPLYRPHINSMVTELRNLDEDFENARSPLFGPSSRPPSPLPPYSTSMDPPVSSFLDDDSRSVTPIDTVVKQLNTGTQQEQYKAVELIKRYANLNHRKAKFQLAVYLLKMRDTKQNSNTHMDVDNAYTDETLGNIQLDIPKINVYYLTKFERQLYGCKLLKDAADAGHTDAQCRYATVLRGGNQALQPSIERAKYYLGRSIMSEHPSAYYYLAQIYDSEDKVQAINYYKQAALKGHMKALDVLEERKIKFNDPN